MKARKFIGFFSILLAAGILLSACGGSTITAADHAERTEAAAYNGEKGMIPEMNAQEPKEGMSDTAPAPSENQKLIRTLRISMETLDFDKSLAGINTLTVQAGGYIESSTVNGQSYNNRSYRSASFVIRVPAAKLEEAESALSSLGNVTSSTSEVSDVTLTWADTESRIKALTAQRDSLLTMLEKAEDLSDLLTIQDHLTEVEYQLESYASQLRVLDNKVSYSTIRLTLNEVKIYTEEEPESFGARISRTFRQSLKNVGTFFSDLAVFVVGNLPAILCWVVFILLVIFGVRGISKRSKAKRKQQGVVPLPHPPVMKDDNKDSDKPAD